MKTASSPAAPSSLPDEAVGGDHREAVHGAADGDAEMEVARAAEVLDGGEEAGRDDVDAHDEASSSLAL